MRWQGLPSCDHDVVLIDQLKIGMLRELNAITGSVRD
jgi:hypothetical protein